MKNEFDFYNNIKNWNFSMIKCDEEYLTNWHMYDILKKVTTKDSRILDLGTGGGEKVIKLFPKVQEIIATDYSPEMIKTANENLLKSNRKNIKFKTMNNLEMHVPDNYFDVVVARHTCIDAKQIYKTLKPNGELILRGVDKMDCWSLKLLFGKGQGFKDDKPISVIDYENILSAGFKNVELVPIHIREYYKTKEDLLYLLYKTPIINDFSEIVENNFKNQSQVDSEFLEKYISENTFEKGILLIRRYYGITAIK